MSQNDNSLAINGGRPVSKKVIPIHKPYLDKDDSEAVRKAVESTFLSGDGPACKEFEKGLATYLGVKHAYFTTSCTVALDLAFRIKNFPRDSEVIIPDFTYTSTALGPLLNNLRVRLADVDSENGNIDVNKLENLITEKTVAIVPVDYAGNPADMDKINQIAKRYNLYVVHDTAQSMGSSYKGKKTGTLADVSTFSFHGTKNLTTGEGGAIVTDDDELAKKIIIMREKGTNKHSFLTDNISRGYYEYMDIGNSYVQFNILGALGVAQLAKIERMNAERAKIANFYIQELSDIAAIKMPKISAKANTNWHIFYILVPAGQKYWILDALRAEGVYSNVHYTPLHRNKFYSHLGTDENFKGAMKFFGGLLRLPIYPSLNETERTCVTTAVRKVLGYSI